MISAEQRDNDLKVLNGVNMELAQIPGLCFLISGSYAIEALTKTAIDHGDMDSNIYTENIPKASTNVSQILDNVKLKESKLMVYKKTADRLEYDVVTNGNITPPRKLEIHLIEAKPDLDGTPDRFILKTPETNKVSKVSLIKVEIQNSRGEKYFFKAKSLAYSIATWAIRISGFAEKQLRPLRATDLEGLKLLLTQNFATNEVLESIKYHPQAPAGKLPEEIFHSALKVVKKESI